MLKENLRALTTKFLHSQPIQGVLKRLALVYIAIVERRPHRENPPKLAAAWDVDQVYTFHINLFEAVMGERKNIDWTVHPNIAFELVDRDPSMKRVAHYAFCSTSVENETPFDFLCVDHCDFDLEIFRGGRYENLEHEKWLNEP